MLNFWSYWYIDWLSNKNPEYFEAFLIAIKKFYEKIYCNNELFDDLIKNRITIKQLWDISKNDINEESKSIVDQINYDCKQANSKINDASGSSSKHQDILTFPTIINEEDDNSWSKDEVLFTN